MTLQQWLFSIKGRIGRRDFWIWIAIWAVTMVALFSLAGGGLVDWFCRISDVESAKVVLLVV